MKKKQFIQHMAKLGYKCAYSGNKRTMYISGHPMFPDLSFKTDFKIVIN